MFLETITMYVWGTPCTVTLDVYIWIMRGETRNIRLKRAQMVVDKRKREGGLSIMDKYWNDFYKFEILPRNEGVSVVSNRSMHLEVLKVKTYVYLDNEQINYIVKFYSATELGKLILELSELQNKGIAFYKYSLESMNTLELYIYY